jgi:hypothetical protein
MFFGWWQVLLMTSCSWTCEGRRWCSTRWTNLILVRGEQLQFLEMDSNWIYLQFYLFPTFSRTWYMKMNSKRIKLPVDFSFELPAVVTRLSNLQPIFSSKLPQISLNFTKFKSATSSKNIPKSLNEIHEWMRHPTKECHKEKFSRTFRTKTRIGTSR